MIEGRPVAPRGLPRKRRKRFRNGVMVGVRSREWWVGVRHDFAMDGWEVGVFGLTVFLPAELFARFRRARRRSN